VVCVVSAAKVKRGKERRVLFKLKKHELDIRKARAAGVVKR
jgi:hypothetical protein